MNNLLPELKCHNEITPENTDKYGFIWVQDIIYDIDAQYEVMTDLVKMVNSGEYILGNPASLKNSDVYSGLYKKL